MHGVLLYKAEPKYAFLRVVIAELIITLFINIILNTCWLSILYAKAFAVFSMARIIKNFVAFPIHVLIVFALYELIYRTNLSKKL